SRNRPSATACSRSRFVAAISRTSAVSVTVPPTRSYCRSCSTRSSFACRPGISSPISSRNSVPPAASSKRPRVSLSAPVKAPRPGLRHGQELLLLGQPLMLHRDDDLRGHGLRHLDVGLPVPAATALGEVDVAVDPPREEQRRDEQRFPPARQDAPITRVRRVE